MHHPNADFSALLLISTKVSTLFKDGTIGGDINVVIVGLILLDEDQVSLRCHDFIALEISCIDNACSNNYVAPTLSVYL